jgi:hypothetical protein
VLNRKTRETILVILVLVIPIAMWVMIDEDLLWKVAVGLLALGAAGVFSVRKYLDRLDRAMRVLPDPAQGGQFDRAAIPLKPIEKMILGIQDIAHPERIRRALLGRRSMLVALGVFFGSGAVIGLIVLLGFVLD